MSASSSPISTYLAKLYYKSGNSYVEVWSDGIKSFGDMGGSPESIDITTLNDPKSRNITGIQSFDTMEFEINYVPSAWSALEAICDSTTLQTWKLSFGTDNGDFYWKGVGTCWISGGGVNEAVSATIAIANETAITTTEPST